MIPVPLPSYTLEGIKRRTSTDWKRTRPSLESRRSSTERAWGPLPASRQASIDALRSQHASRQPSIDALRSQHASRQASTEALRPLSRQASVDRGAPKDPAALGVIHEALVSGELPVVVEDVQEHKVPLLRRLSRFWQFGGPTATKAPRTSKDTAAGEVYAPRANNTTEASRVSAGASPSDKATKAPKIPTIALSPAPAVLSPESHSSTMGLWNFGSGTKSPKVKDTTPNLDAMPTETLPSPALPAEIPRYASPAQISSSAPPTGIPHSAPPAELPRPVTPVPLPKAPSIGAPLDDTFNVAGVRKTKPKRRKRIQSNVSKKTKPLIKKARKALLKRKILELLFGKKVARVIAPHINLAAEGTENATGNVPSPTPTAMPTAVPM